MKKYANFLLPLFAFLVLATSCQQEEVVSENQTPNVQALITDPPCGSIDTLQLAKASGSLNVDYCGGLPCPTRHFEQQSRFYQCGVAKRIQ